MKESSPLETALAAKRPMPATNAEELEALEVELLVPQHKRRIVTVGDHQRFRETLEHPHKDDSDLDGLIADIREVERSRK